METEAEASHAAKASPVMFSPYSSPNATMLLQRRVHAWTQGTGLPPTVHVRAGDRSFDLHEAPLISKCGYFSVALLRSCDIGLPGSFPGGAEGFEMAALLCYGYTVALDPFNVAVLRCAAEFLDMGDGRERCDLYINQVVLQSWDDTLIVLQKCQPLLPVAEELLIVSRCVESLAFMACMEILDPEQRRDRPVVGTQALVGRRWDAELVKELAAHDLWIKDLIALPFEFFKKIIGSLRKQGMKEKYVSPIVLFYANKWLLSKKTHKFWESADESNGENDANKKASSILEGILELLPAEEKAGSAVPAAFYFALLSRSLSLELSQESRGRLQKQVVSRLRFARVEDLPLPERGIRAIANSPEVRAMESIISLHVSSQGEGGYGGPTPASSRAATVAQVWDRYLAEIVRDPKLEPQRFADLIDAIPAGDRKSHDHLYEAINRYLLEHPGLSGEEKSSLCGRLDCRRLSQETCIRAVQNELMPLRLIVQALFVQQLHTHRAFKECSDSFRYMHSGDISGLAGYTPSSRCHVPSSQPLSDSSPYTQDQIAGQEQLCNATEYETASFRIHALEQEILSLKQTLQGQSAAKVSVQRDAKAPSFRLVAADGAPVAFRRRNQPGHAGSCIGSIRWGSQRRCASRILRVFARIAMFGRSKSRVK